MRTYTTLFVAMLLTAACNRHQEGEATPAASAAPSAPVAVAAVPPSAEVVPAAAPAEPAGSAVPVPEDYEAQAKKTIKSDTLDTQLDKLEKQITGAAK